MTDLEKLILGLECCKAEKICASKCPYKGQCDDGGYYYSKAIEDAISLLEALEPRVLTLEEIPEYDGAFLIEYRHEVWPMQWALFRLNLTTAYRTAYRFIRGDSELGFSISNDVYGKTWRCWTARPTDEQRAATPWEPPKKG